MASDTTILLDDGRRIETRGRVRRNGYIEAVGFDGETYANHGEGWVRQSRPVGRPVGPDGPSLRVQVRIPETILADLDASAKRDGITRSRAIVDALRAYLDR